MSAYALAHLREVAIGPEFVEYLQRIDATLAPFGAASSSTAEMPRCSKGPGRGTS